jgi:hypothetical protein
MVGKLSPEQRFDIEILDERSNVFVATAQAE